jgi:tRNA(Ile)-lysidine synthetase-like protein
MKPILDRKIIPLNCSIVVGVSGGIDSMVLLDNLLRLRERSGWTLIVAHVDHGKREQSKAEYQLVQSIANKHQLAFFGKRLGHLPKGNFHQRARDERMKFFETVAKETGAPYVALAHHQDDQAETILMRLIRGSSLVGYAGMDKVSHHGDLTILRPFLDVKKETIRAYQIAWNVPYLEDESNQSDDYARNRVRHQIAPLLARENPAWKSNAVQFATLLNEAYEVVADRAIHFMNHDIQTENERLIFASEAFHALPRAVKREVLKRLYDRQMKDQSECPQSLIDQMIRLIDGPKPNGELHLTKDKRMIKNYNQVFFEPTAEETRSMHYEIPSEGNFTLPNGDSVIIDSQANIIDGNGFEIWYNDPSRFFPITVRTRRPGDKMIFAFGSKKIKDVLIDAKMSIPMRNRIVLFETADGEIVYIPLLKLSSQPHPGNHRIVIRYQKGSSHA